MDQCSVCREPKHRPENDTGYLGLPHHIREGFQSYIEEHQPMGSFGMSVLRNDLCGAVSRADGINRPLLADTIRWLYNEAPSDCWGSPQAVEAWLSAGKGGE